MQISQQFLINQIASGLSTTTELIQSLSSEIKDNSIELAIMKADLNNVISDVRTLSRILREGNGAAPVLSRLAVLETTSNQLQDGLKDIEKEQEALGDKIDTLAKNVEVLITTKKLEAEDKQSRRGALIAIITSVIALISAVLVALIG